DLDLACDLEATPGSVDGAERGAKDLVDQSTAAEPMDPCAQESQDVRVIAAGILLDDVQHVAIVFRLGFAIGCRIDSAGACRPDRNLMKTQQQLLCPSHGRAPHAPGTLRRNAFLATSPAVDASRTS